jgi:hypothetical protein
MGFFSRKDKSSKAKPALETSNSNTSLHSGSSIKSPAPTSNFGRGGLNRTSAGTNSTGPGTPLTPFSPAHSMAKIDLPRPPDPQLDPAGYLRSLNAVRERCSIITDKALKNDLRHFDVDMGKFDDVVTFVANIIKVRLSYHIVRRKLVTIDPNQVHGLERLRCPFHEHSTARPTPALCGWRPRPCRPPSIYLPRGSGQHGEMQTVDRLVPGQRPSRRRCRYTMELQER